MIKTKYLSIQYQNGGVTLFAKKGAKVAGHLLRNCRKSHASYDAMSNTDAARLLSECSHSVHIGAANKYTIKKD